MRDMWLAPPGDDGSVRKNRRRDVIRPALVLGTVLSLVAGGLTYTAMKQSTAVSTADVLEDFRSAKTKGEAPDSATESEPGAAAKASKRATSPRGEAKRRGTGKSQPATLAASSSPRNDGEAGTTSQPNAPGGAQSGPTRVAPRRAPPEEGVYEWAVEGVERGPGVERELLERSHRVITHEGGERWEEHHIFSEQKEMWFNLGLSDEGVLTYSSRNKVKMGPVTVDRTVTFDPPVLVSNIPYKLGETWEGSWSGKTSGTYTGRTIEHTWLTIDGERVEVWGSEVRMTMRGEVDGTVLTRTWVSPKYRLAVKQYQETDVRSGPGSYYSRWTGQVLSVTPQT